MNFRNEVDFFLKGSVWSRKRIRGSQVPDLDKVLSILVKHPLSAEYEVYLCGGIVNGHYNSDIDVVVSGGFFDEYKLYGYFTEVTQSVLDEVGVELDILYYPDISWMEGAEGVFRVFFAFNILVDVRGGEVFRERFYSTEKLNVLHYMDITFPTLKSKNRDYDLDKIKRVEGESNQMKLN